MTHQRDADRPDHAGSPPARKVRKFEFAGAGALVQLMGVVALGGAAYAGFREAGGGWMTTLFAVWVGAGFAFCLVLLLIGSELSKKYACGHCGHLLADRRVALCPTCNGRLL